MAWCLFLRGRFLLYHWLDPQRRSLLLLARHRRVLRHVTAQIARQLTLVIGIDVGVVLPTGDRHVRKTTVNQQFALLRSAMSA
jgi:hypothetical protein